MENLKTVAATTKKKVIYIAKKGSKYIAIVNNELKLTTTQVECICSETVDGLQKFIDNATIDTRNAKTIGNNYSIIHIHL